MLYIITAVHNRYDITKSFIELLNKQTFRDWTLILVDDGSTDGTADMAKELVENLVVIQGDGSLFWGGALHKAYQWICDNTTDEQNDDMVMFANDDTKFDSDYLEKAISILSKREKTLLTGFGISQQTGVQADGAIEFDFKTTSVLSRDKQTGNCASTRSLFFRVGDFKKIGGFHPKMLPHYGSDYEWTIRACHKYGYTVYCDESLKYYVNEETTGDNSYQTMTRKKAFSKRSGSNPIYRFNMILLSTPLKYIMPAIFNQAGRYLGKFKIIFKIMKR